MADEITEDKIVVELSGDARAHGEKVKELSFRRPDGADITKRGLPLRIFDDGSFEISGPSMSKHMSVLGAVPPSTIENLDGGDWTKCALELAPAFLPQD